MDNQKDYEKYEEFPTTIIVLRTLFEILVYGVGAVILARFSIWIGIYYVAYCALMAGLVIAVRCKYCYYYGKSCPSGSGRIAPYLVEKGLHEKFSTHGRYMVPAVLTWVLPVFGGITLVVQHFSWIAVGLLLLFVVLRFYVSEKISIKYGCVHCMQKDDCPTYQLKHEEEK